MSDPEASAAARLVVAVHDVAPSTLSDVGWLLARLDGLGASPRTLLAIPDEGGRGPLRRGDETSALLATEAGRGAEIVLHGLTHRRSGALRGPWSDRLRTRLFAPAAAEFQTLTPTAMAERVARGRSILAEAVGVAPLGFCAPAWLAAPGLSDALRREGFGFEIGLLGVRGLDGPGRWVRAPSVGSMGVGGLHEALVAVGGTLSLAAEAWWPGIDALQVFLHPQGAARARSAARALRILERLLRTHPLVSYAQLVAG